MIRLPYEIEEQTMLTRARLLGNNLISQENRRRLSDSIWRWIADHLPRRLVYWVGIRLWVHGTTGPYSCTVATELTIDEAIRRWEGWDQERKEWERVAGNWEVGD